MGVGPVQARRGRRGDSKSGVAAQFISRCESTTIPQTPNCQRRLLQPFSAVSSADNACKTTIMAESSKDNEVPTDPAASSTPQDPADDPSAPSKKGAKKAEAKAKKEAEKARKAAEREAAAAASGNAGPAEDLAKDNYGPIQTSTKVGGDVVHLRDIKEEHFGTVIKLRAWIQNARMQGAKMAFVELREEGNWTIQGVVGATADGAVSKQMVKWIGGLKLESFVAVEAEVKKPLESVKSTKVSEYELHLKKAYLVAAAPEMLTLGMGPASRAVGSLAEEEDTSESAVDAATKATEGQLSPFQHDE